MGLYVYFFVNAILDGKIDWAAMDASFSIIPFIVVSDGWKNPNSITAMLFRHGS